MSRNRELLGSRNRPPNLAKSSASEVIRRLDLTINRKLDGMLHGDYQGLVPGHGSELGETREYVPGDDVRRIDWNVTARMPDVHIRQTIADRELECWVLADLSASLDFGTADCEKRDLAVAAVAAIGFLTHKMGNRIGAITLSSTGLQTIPARTGRSHLQALLHKVVTVPPAEGGGTTSLGPAVRRLGAIAGRRGLAVVISDFLSPPDWEKPLRALSAGHDVLAIEIIDPRELSLPDVGLLEVVDPETGQRREVPTSNRRFRDRYANAAKEQREQIARSVRSAGADHLVLRTDRDWLLDLVRFVALRRRRVETLPRISR
jgi:uncharacterized protein (DUF58 family)